MDLIIKSTNDYSMFKKLKGNRDLTSVNKIIQSVEDVGYIISPILVNEKWKSSMVKTDWKHLRGCQCRFTTIYKTESVLRKQEV